MPSTLTSTNARTCSFAVRPIMASALRRGRPAGRRAGRSTAPVTGSTHCGDRTVPAGSSVPAGKTVPGGTTPCGRSRPPTGTVEPGLSRTQPSGSRQSFGGVQRGREVVRVGQAPRERQVGQPDWPGAGPRDGGAGPPAAGGRGAAVGASAAPPAGPVRARRRPGWPGSMAASRSAVTRQVDEVADDRAGDVGRERERQHEVQRLRQVVAGPDELVEDRLQRPQARRACRRGCALTTRVPTAPSSPRAVSASVSWARCRPARSGRGRGRPARRRSTCRLPAEPAGQPVERVDGADDVGLLLVQAADERVELPQRVPERRARGRRARSPSSWLMVRSWARPPPLSSSPSAASTSSTSAPRLVRDSGMTSPSARRPWPGSVGGAASATNFSPSRLVWRTAAVALAGRRDVAVDAQPDPGGPAGRARSSRRCRR